MLAFITDHHGRIIAVGDTDEIFGLEADELGFNVVTEDKVNQYVVTTDNGVLLDVYEKYNEAAYFVKNDEDDLWILAIED